MTMEQIYTGFGITILKQDTKFFLQYDGGEMVAVMKKIEISEQEAKAIQEQRDGKAIYDYMIKYLNDRI